MFPATELAHRDLCLSYPAPGFKMEGTLDHPTTWLEMLSALPCVDDTSLCVDVELGGSERVFVRANSIKDAVLVEGTMTGSRAVQLRISDDHEAYKAEMEFRVTAGADQVELAAVLVSAEPALLANPLFAGVLSIAMAKMLFSAAQNVIEVMHKALSPDLADTAVKFSLVMPSNEYREMLKLGRDELGFLEDDSAEYGVTFPFTCEARYGEDEAPTQSGARRTQLDAQARLALALNLCELREARNLKQLQVAHQALGFEKSHAAVSRLERGILDEVDTERLEKLAAFFDTTVADLLVNNLTTAEPTADGDTDEPALFDPTREFVTAPGMGKRLVLARTAAGLSQMALARKLGHECPGTVQQWENEEMVPRRTSFIDLGYAMTTPVAWLMFGRRVRTSNRGIALRLTAMQKLYGLSNAEAGALMETSNDEQKLDVARKLVGKMNTARKPPARASVERLAHVLQVPADWLSPPTDGVLYERERTAEISANLAQDSNKMAKLSRTAKKLISDIIDLVEMGLITDKDVTVLRSEMVTRFTTPYIRKKNGTGATGNA